MILILFGQSWLNLEISWKKKIEKFKQKSLIGYIFGITLVIFACLLIIHQLFALLEFYKKFEEN